MRVAHAGEYRALWVGADRRWYVYGPGEVLYARLKGSRATVVGYMRRLQGWPTGHERGGRRCTRATRGEPKPVMSASA
jgi:hypothetical protein